MKKFFFAIAVFFATMTVAFGQNVRVEGYYRSNGTYVIAPAPIDYWSIVTDSISYSVLIDSTYNSYDSLDFGFFPDTLIQELKVDLEGYSMQRCNLQ